MVALSLTSRALWLHRFEAVPGVQPLVLNHHPEEVAELVRGAVELPKKSGEGLGLTAGAVPAQVVYQWQGLPSSEYVSIATEVGCEGLELGRQYDWQDGRIFVIWVDEKGGLLKDFLSIWSGRGDRKMRVHDVILPIRRQGGLPKLVIENLGSSGHMTVKFLTVQPVRERAGVRWAGAGVLVAWLGVLSWGGRRWIVRGRAISFWRVVAAAGLCIGFTWYAAFPGPWVPLRPLLGRFAVVPVAIPEPPVAPAPSPGPLAAGGGKEGSQEKAAEPGRPEAGAAVVAKAPEPPAFPAEAKGPPAKLAGGALRSFMYYLPGLKIWVHFLVFAGMAAVLAFLTGSRRAAYVAGALGFVSEFCEWGYGFGVDWGDAGDLAMDAAAVLVGLIFWKYASRWLARRWGLRLV
ncbi:MAG: hypothetical protein JWO82_4397 [Akkermansiaceae bacterium]|nr:hypothetical protein [Akkermansiaceae bacterium]